MKRFLYPLFEGSEEENNEGGQIYVQWSMKIKGNKKEGS